MNTTIIGISLYVSTVLFAIIREMSNIKRLKVLNQKTKKYQEIIQLHKLQIAIYQSIIADREDEEVIL